jgi:hypothetical protein
MQRSSTVTSGSFARINILSIPSTHFKLVIAALYPGTVPEFDTENGNDCELWESPMTYAYDASAFWCRSAAARCRLLAAAEHPHGPAYSRAQIVLREN